MPKIYVYANELSKAKEEYFSSQADRYLIDMVDIIITDKYLEQMRSQDTHTFFPPSFYYQAIGDKIVDHLFERLDRFDKAASEVKKKSVFLNKHQKEKDEYVRKTYEETLKKYKERNAILKRIEKYKKQINFYLRNQAEEQKGK